LRQGIYPRKTLQLQGFFVPGTSVFTWVYPR
jgi:hypothetical protein